MKEPIPAAVATLLIQDGKILLGRRTDNHQFSGWQCPGGYLQKGESAEQAANRLSLKKAGIKISTLRSGPYSNNIFPDHHTVTLYIIAEAYQIENRACFENSVSQWRWFDCNELPALLFLPLKILTSEYKLLEL